VSAISVVQLLQCPLFYIEAGQIQTHYCSLPSSSFMVNGVSKLPFHSEHSLLPEVCKHGIKSLSNESTVEEELQSPKVAISIFCNHKNHGCEHTKLWSIYNSIDEMRLHVTQQSESAEEVSGGGTG
jgi:hypothetical protein